MAETKRSIESLLNSPAMSPAARARVSLLLSHSRLLLLLAAAAGPKAQAVPVPAQPPIPVSAPSPDSEKTQHSYLDTFCTKSAGSQYSFSSPRTPETDMPAIRLHIEAEQNQTRISVRKGGRGESPEALSGRGGRQPHTAKHKSAGARAMRRSRAKGGHPIRGCALETVEAICAYLDKQAIYWNSRNDIKATEYSQARSFLIATFENQPNAFDRTYESVWKRTLKEHLEFVRKWEAMCKQSCAPAPDPQTHIVDGRNGEEWARSVLDYLSWRSGRSWRRRRYGDPLQEIYDLAWRLVNDAMRTGRLLGLARDGTDSSLLAAPDAATLPAIQQVSAAGSLSLQSTRRQKPAEGYPARTRLETEKPIGGGPNPPGAMDRRQLSAAVAQPGRAPADAAMRPTPEVESSTLSCRSNSLPEKKPVQSVKNAKRRTATA